MKHLRWALFLTSIVACSGEPQRQPVSVKLVEITVETTMAMVIVGQEANFTATGIYDDTTTKTLTTEVEWTVDDESVAEVIRDGVVDTRAVGTVNVIATLDDTSGSFSLTVIPTPIRSIEVSPATATIQERQTQRFTAEATFRDGTTMDLTTVLAWASTNDAVATVDAGLASGVAPGRVDISATDPITTAKGVGILTVEAPTVDSITIAPSSVSVAVGQMTQIAAIADLSNGETLDVTAAVEWMSNDTQLVTIGTGALEPGLLDGRRAGTTQIVARHVRSNSRATATVTVTPAVIEMIAVSPNARSVGLGETVFLSAVATLSDGTSSDVTNTVDWRSSAPSVATVSNAALEQGTVMTVSVGTATISAFDSRTGIGSDDIGMSAVITVTPATLVRIEVTPATAQLAAGLTQTFVATGVYSDNSRRNLSTVVNWSSTNAAAATVDNLGLVTGVAPGSTMIAVVDPVTQTASGSNSAALEILPPNLLSIGVTPARQTIVQGRPQQLTATGRYTDGMDRDITTAVLWFSNNNTAVTVAPTGIVTAQQVGTATISARHTASGIMSTTTMEDAVITVEPLALVTLEITPSVGALPIGATLPLVATGTYNDGAVIDLTDTVVWSSQSPAIVSVGTGGNQLGLARAVSGGAATIDALDVASGVTAVASNDHARINVLPTVTLSALSITPETYVVNLNQQRQLEAMGQFSDGSTHLMTDTVTWNSTAPTIASIDNTDGTRGVLTGLVVGTASITATHVPSGLSTVRPAAVTVQVGTIARSWNGPTVTVDSTAPFGINVGSVSFGTADFPGTAGITDVDVAVNFLKTDGSCAAPLTGLAYHNETSFRIQSPSGVQVILAPVNTWSGNTAISPVTVAFDQSAPAPPSGTPVSGTFRPVTGNLDTLNGTTPVGTWILQAGDSAGGDPLCVIAYTITVTAQ